MMQWGPAMLLGVGCSSTHSGQHYIEVDESAGTGWCRQCGVCFTREMVEVLVVDQPCQPGCGVGYDPPCQMCQIREILKKTETEVVIDAEDVDQPGR